MCTKWQVSLIFRLVRGRNYRHIYIIQVNLGILEIPHRLHTSRGLDNKINDEKLVLQTFYSEYPYPIASSPRVDRSLPSTLKVIYSQALIG